MLTTEQRERRRHGIGSSDIPKIVGVSPHGGPLDVYLDKLGLSEHEESAATWCGDRLEETIAQLYKERTGVAFAPQIGTVARPGGPGWAMATPDRWLADDAGLVEIKLVGAGMAHLWGEAPPEHVIVQVQWQLEVCDVEKADVAALIGGTDFRVYHVERDRALGDELLERGRRFWEEHVLRREPPWSSGADLRRVMRLRYPMSVGDVLPASGEARALHAELLRVHERQETLEQLRAALEGAAMDLIGDADGIEGLFTWRNVGKAEPWKRAARARFMAGAQECWEDLERVLGDNEERWKAMALRGGATPTSEQETRNAGRRFLLKRPKEASNGGGQKRGIGALQGAAGATNANDLRGEAEASRRAFPDEW